MTDVTTGGTTRYFIAKCYNFQGLKKCWTTSQWACNERKTGDQTWKILLDAFTEGKVVLVFSVNNCHGYHGYATLTTPPLSVAEKLEKSEETTTSSSEKELQEGLWHKFTVQWDKIFMDKHGERCLSFDQTKHLYCLENATPVNKARNFQEIDAKVGQEMVMLIDNEYKRLCDVIERNLAIKEANKPEPFLKMDTDDEELENENIIWNTVLTAILKKVSCLGKVILACPFGSQRYNCHTKDSDLDMFIVYQAPTSALLGFHPPLATIKSRDGEKYDYTILELQRFLELILAGDPRCVEALFIDQSIIYKESEEYSYLCELRQRFLSKQCVDKYLNDACGAKGLRLMEKWVKSGEALLTPMPRKVGKLFYIIIRLLQNANDIVKDKTLHVFRGTNTDQRCILLQARSSDLTYEECRNIVESLEKETRTLKETYMEQQNQDEIPIHDIIEKWLINVRHTNLNDELGN